MSYANYGPQNKVPFAIPEFYLHSRSGSGNLRLYTISTPHLPHPPIQTSIPDPHQCSLARSDAEKNDRRHTTKSDPRRTSLGLKTDARRPPCRHQAVPSITGRRARPAFGTSVPRRRDVECRVACSMEAMEAMESGYCGGFAPLSGLLKSSSGTRMQRHTPPARHCEEAQPTRQSSSIPSLFPPPH